MADARGVLARLIDFPGLVAMEHRIVPQAGQTLGEQSARRRPAAVLSALVVFASIALPMGLPVFRSRIQEGPTRSAGTGAAERPPGIFLRAFEIHYDQSHPVRTGGG